MLIDVLVAGFLGLALFTGLLQLTLETIQLNDLAVQAVLSSAVLIDLEGQLRLNQLTTGNESVATTDVCASNGELLTDWCDQLDDRLGLSLPAPTIALSVVDEQFRAVIALPSAEPLMDIASADASSAYITRTWPR